MRLVRLLLVLCCIAFGVALAALNDDPVVLDLLWIELSPPLGLLVLAMLLTGALLGGLAALLSRRAPPASASADDEAVQ